MILFNKEKNKFVYKKLLKVNKENTLTYRYIIIISKIT